MKNVLKTGFAASTIMVSAVLLTACVGDGVNNAGPVDVKPLDIYVSQIEVTDTQESLSVGVSGPVLDQMTRENVAAFAHLYLNRGKGAMTMTVPAGSENAEIAHETAVAVRALLRHKGVADLALNATVVDATGQTNPGITLGFASTKAKGPECGAYEDLRRSYHNATTPNFGCATAGNLAAMIADPQDLREPQKMDAASGARGAAAVGAYMSGETAAAPSASVSGTGGE